jgi:UDP-3-O-[3-hydroxymyristoyl] glucosamine N-acyltransferase
MKITDVNGTEQTIPKGARGGFVSKEAIIGPSVVIYPATLILKGAVVEEGTVFGRLDINSPIVVKQNQYIDKGVYLALENVMNKEVLNYKVD